MSNRILASTRKGLFALEPGSNGWRVTTTAFLGENITLTMVDPRDGGWYTTIDMGHFGTKLKYSPDQGKTWEERAVPEYPEGSVIATADGKPPAPATLKLIWALQAGAVSQPKRLWAGTIPGGLFRSDDGGQSWMLINSLWERPERMKWFGGGRDQPGIHSLCLDPRAAGKTLRLAISCGGVWITEDEGETWHLGGQGLIAEYMPPELQGDSTIQDPHMMQQCLSKPDCLWIQHHNGVFRSQDGGKTWVNIKNVLPSVFGFAVAVHPKDPQTAWFVPAIKDERRIPVDGQLVVARTRDNGESFEVLRNGLPQEHAYDIVFRHALVVDDTGNKLAFGSTTGGLWTTDNQGDTWQAAVGRFPPIHAVCYA
jgi:hypothetical protein